MIRSRAQLTDPEFRERMGYAGAEPIHLLELPGLHGRWGVHIEHDPDPDSEGRDFYITTGEVRARVTRGELLAMAVDVLTRLEGGGRVEWGNVDPDYPGEVWAASLRTGDGTDEALARRRAAKWSTPVMYRRIGPWTKEEGNSG